MKSPPPAALSFPEGFLFGCATAAHQVEGGNHANDWWAWEQLPGHIKNGDRSDPACEQFQRFASDFDLLRSLHQNAHRLSLEWSRIEPAPGEFSATALAHYRDVLHALRDRGMEPMVTLHHFTNPTWIADAGGWESPQTPEYFARFAERVTNELAGLARLWITINEPTVVAYQGYIRGEWPPGKHDFGAALRVVVQLIRGHWLAYERIKRRHPELQVGLAHHLRIFDPARWFAPQDRIVATAFNRVFNLTMLRSLRKGRLVFPLTRHGLTQNGRPSGPPQSQDFIGLNYYTRELVKFNHRYGAEAGSIATNLTGGIKNVGLVYIDATGVSRRALLKSVAKGMVVGRMRDGKQVVVGAGDGGQVPQGVNANAEAGPSSSGLGVRDPVVRRPSPSPTPPPAYGASGTVSLGGTPGSGSGGKR